MLKIPHYGGVLRASCVCLNVVDRSTPPVFQMNMAFGERQTAHSQNLLVCRDRLWDLIFLLSCNRLR